MSIFANGHHNDEANGGEDSDLESDFAIAAAESGEDFYQPISDGSDSDSEEPPDEITPTYIQLNEANGNGNGNGISSLNLNSDESESEEEENVGESEADIGEEERERRRLELTQERSERIREAMRGVEFRGAVPVWAERIGEEQWIDQLRRIRGETTSSSSNSNLNTNPPSS